LEVDGVPPDKFQSHEVGLLLDKSVKLTVKGAVPEVILAEKFATGAVGVLSNTVM